MISIDLISHGPIQKWRPMHGDIIHYTGWFTRWVGIIIGISNGGLNIIRAGTMTELCGYSQKEQDQNTISLSVEEITRTRAKYAVNRVENNVNTWYL